MPNINIWEEDQSGVTYASGGEVVFVPVAAAAPSGIASLLDKNKCYLWSNYATYSNTTGVIDPEDYIGIILQAGMRVCAFYGGTSLNLSTVSLAFLEDKDAYNIKFISSGMKPTVIASRIVPGETSVVGYYTRTGSEGASIFTPATGEAVADAEYYSLDIKEVSLAEGASIVGYYTLSEGVYTQQTSGTAESGTTYYDITAKKLSATVDVTLYNKLCNVAKNRGDCAIIGSLDSNGIELGIIKQILDGNLAALTGTLGDGAKYGALFAADMDAEELSTYPDLAYFKKYGEALRMGSQWEAIAGVTRGKLEGFDKNALVTKFALDNNVQTEEGYTFNGICALRPSGNTIWGDRTTLNNPGALKASSFLSIRNIVSDIAKRAYDQAVIYTFETNNEITWSNFKNALVILLNQMVQAQVLATYSIKKTAAKERATIACNIHISPYGPVENFDIGIILDSNGLDINMTE